MRTLQEDKEIMRLLDITELSRVIAHTNKGYLFLKLFKGNDSYKLVLDAVPLPKDLNKELMDIMFPVKQMEVQQVNKDSFKGFDKLPMYQKKQIGRPKGAKSGLKTEEMMKK